MQGLIVNGDSLENNAVCPGQRKAHIGDRQAPFFVIVRVGFCPGVGAKAQSGVNNVALVGLSAAVSPLPHKNPQGNPDLWSGKTDSRGRAHGVDHVVDQFAKKGVPRGDLLCARVEDGVAGDADGTNWHCSSVVEGLVAPAPVGDTRGVAMIASTLHRQRRCWRGPFGGRALMTQRPWLSHYPSDVAHELEKSPFAHVPAMVSASSAQWGKKTAFTQVMANGMNGSLSYAQIDTLSDHFAGYLREELGLAQGDRVAVQMPNCLAYPIVAFGIFKAGCVLVNTNPLYTPSEMVRQFSDSGATTLVVIDMFADRLPKVLSQTAITTVVTVRISEFFSPVVAGVIRLVQKVWSRSLPKITVEHTPFRKALAAGRKKASPEAAAGYLTGMGPDSLAALQYTGGTTGVSKGAMLSHGNLVANTGQLLSFVGNFLRPGVEIVVTALPLYHIFAFTVNLLAFYQRGGRNLLIPNPRPPSTLKRAFENYKVTWVTGVNTLFNALMNERWFSDSPPKHLRFSAAGGMALQSSVAERWRTMTGTPIVEGYGLTETAPVLAFNPFGGLQKDGTLGVPVPSTDIQLIDEAGVPVGVGEPGELVCQGPQVMLGYWNKEAETKVAMEGGWFRTGDIAVMDSDGFFTIVDRKKDMILVSGFNVYPNEVEEQIAAVSGVLEVGVVGIPDDKSGEAVRAYIVASLPAPSAEGILAHCREHLSGYKVPGSVIFVDELPKSPIGKILRRELRDLAMASLTTTKGR